MMNKQQLVEIIAEQLGVDESKIKEESNLVNDLGADSLDTLELVMTLEQEFKVEISDSEAEKLETVADIIKFVNNKLKK
ncbi:MAG: acyl carrier protein [Crocinitomicaceae bacterium TMED45]|nr:MAG: acyl carrier protein [Crocinitomicaceae bacterium TMED45]